ncbi:hypothetical protein ceV_133 [Chrysochromulina ericina virus CeV-01B]|jgi:hypothetical protein|uniref:Uncharacterized protein n=1 Tax=Chrysochromulina ericina virus CeV-01B TaxID=3070830 RepID=A0A0N9QA91_9VIRU|nr:hypothetical protein ceV_133 [Chrysochromulina ericina virus]ALH23039.1 hypothetical protein ceV_133 [Chrysochromulina ericina virus CeV-01B]|tara:strand:+ start:831 stop:1577 length:747 start_codon:yes stop_codon:yes gene_type:complete
MVKYTHKQDKKHKNNKKHKKYNLIDKNIKIKAFNESFNKNYISYISILISIFILYKSGKNTKSIINIFLSFILVSINGYFAHYVGHKINFVNWFNTSNNILKEYTITNKIFNSIAKILDFHNNIHHDTDINKKPINIINEFLNNFITQGFFPFLLILFSKSIDLRVCFIWGLSYATVHNINYLYLMPETHMDHHKNSNTNFGMDIWDIIFGTKYNWNDIEDVNHYAINFVLCSIIVVLIHKYFDKFIK